LSAFPLVFADKLQARGLAGPVLQLPLMTATRRESFRSGGEAA